MISTRTLHGVFWGVVATPIAALIPLGARAFGLWPAPEPLVTELLGKAIGPVGIAPLGYILATLWALIAGGFWGGVIAFVSGPVYPEPLARPSVLSYGLAMGFFRALVTNLSVPIWLGWGPFGALVGAKIALAILVSDLAFGLVAGALLASEDWGRFRVPMSKLRFGPL